LYDSIVDLGGTPPVAVIGRGNLTIDGSEIGTASKTQQWQLSAHAAADTEPFRHWDSEEDIEEGGVPGSCSKCHTTPGFVEFAMGDPTTAHLPTTTVDCWSCHNNFNLYANADTRHDDLGTNPAVEPVEFPSGLTATFDNSSNICMSCHQGRASTDTVDAATPNTVEQSPTDYDSYDFINIHYYAAGATLFGTQVRGGYEYDGPSYAGQNTFPVHGSALSDCLQCHMNADTADEPAKHTFLPKVADCSPCHGDPPASFPELGGKPSQDYDDIQTLLGELLDAIQAYGLTELPQPSGVYYEGSSYPYFFREGELPIFPNRYRDFDFDMLTAAYNYNVGAKDPAGYVHNGDYIKQLLYDSIVAMGGTPSVSRP
jgi:hypothetical protein